MFEYFKTQQALSINSTLLWHQHDIWEYKIVINQWVNIYYAPTYMLITTGQDSGSNSGEKRNGPGFMEPTQHKVLFLGRRGRGGCSEAFPICLNWSLKNNRNCQAIGRSWPIWKQEYLSPGVSPNIPSFLCSLTPGSINHSHPPPPPPQFSKPNGTLYY